MSERIHVPSLICAVCGTIFLGICMFYALYLNPGILYGENAASVRFGLISFFILLFVFWMGVLAQYMGFTKDELNRIGDSELKRI